MIKKLCIIALIALCSIRVSAQNADAVLGKWLNPSGEGRVEIYKKGNKYYGRLFWLKFPNDVNGKPKLDKHNPDVNMRSRPELGIELLKNFVFDGEKEYDNGTIYDPKNGKTYSCKMTLEGNVLKIRGYIGISLLGRTESWNRVK
jgi:uncharacterized protein (DUF2147 family)